MFSTPSEREIIISAVFILSSANALNFDLSKMLPCGKRLILAQMNLYSVGAFTLGKSLDFR